MPRPVRPATLLVLNLLACSAAAALAQSAPAAPPGRPAVERALTGHPQRDTILRLSRPVTLDLRDQRLQDVITFVQELTGADITPYYADDANPDGLDPDQLVTLSVTNASALTLIERLLEKAVPAFGQPGDNTWQLTESGSLEIGPKERLNQRRRVELYDINDLLFVIPDFTDAPDFDLNSVLQSGGGGGQSPFQDTGDDSAFEDIRPAEERAQDIIDLITSLIETEQWLDNGGDAASIRYFQGSLIVNAPDYVHRGINGYPWWPTRYTTAATVRDRRYVTLNTDAVASELDFATDEQVVDPD